MGTCGKNLRQLRRRRAWHRALFPTNHSTRNTKAVEWGTRRNSDERRRQTWFSLVLDGDSGLRVTVRPWNFPRQRRYNDANAYRFVCRFNPSMKAKSSKLIVGDWVEVRTKAEILRTLDSNGQLDGMPFMPEMFAFCGKQFQVYKRAHKTCDTVFPVRGRRVADAVHLETRCDGSAHGGCQASCLIFWKDAWLKPISKGSPERAASGVDQRSNRLTGGAPGSACTESAVWTRSQTVDSNPADPTYNCQATKLSDATTQLDW